MTDDELLDQLSASFAATTSEPPADALRALHDAIDARVRPTTAPRTVRRWAIPALAGILVFGGSGAAFAASPTLNRAARQFAHAIGLPVDSPRLDDTRRHREQLRAALQSGDRSKIAAAAAALRDDVQHVDNEERSQIQREADALLRQAEQSLAAEPPQSPNSSGTPDSSTSTPLDPTAVPPASDEPPTPTTGVAGTDQPPDTPSTAQPPDTASTAQPPDAPSTNQPPDAPSTNQPQDTLTPAQPQQTPSTLEPQDTPNTTNSLDSSR